MSRAGKLFSNFILLLCLIIWIIEVGLCMEKYISAATTINVEIKHQTHVPFPEFTICPQFGFKSKILLDHNLYINLTLPKSCVSSSFIIGPNTSKFGMQTRLEVSHAFRKCLIKKVNISLKNF
jgi:hypothetical protein